MRAQVESLVWVGGTGTCELNLATNLQSWGPRESKLLTCQEDAQERQRTEQEADGADLPEEPGWKLMPEALTHPSLDPRVLYPVPRNATQSDTNQLKCRWGPALLPFPEPSLPILPLTCTH